MRISSNEKKDFLLETFELLRQNYQRNKYELRDCIAKIAKIDLTLAIDLLKTLLLENPAANHTTDDFSFGFMYSLEKVIGEEELYKIVAKDNELKNAIYGEAGNLHLIPLFLIRYLISIDDLETANEILQLIDGNPYLKNSWYDILKEIIPSDDTTISENAFDLLSMWIEKVSDREELAKLKLKMLDFLDDEDDDMVSEEPLTGVEDQDKMVRDGMQSSVVPVMTGTAASPSYQPSYMLQTQRSVGQEEITFQIKAGDIVRHKKYGMGHVKSIQPRLIVVTFRGVDRTFSVPFVFDHGLLSLDN